MQSTQSVWVRILLLLALAVCSYLPSLRLPFISDDYEQIPMARQFSAAGWAPLWHDTALRTRATYMFLSASLDARFGFTPVPFYAASILLHVMCVLLVYGMCAWREIPPAVAFWAACFFAVFEGHQEAVMWVAASNELLVFLFGMSAWVCWVKWLQGPNWKWYAVALLAFLLGVASKESIWVFPVLMALPLLWDQSLWRRGLAGITPFALIAAVYIVWVWMSRVAAPGYDDNRFALGAGWFVVALNSLWRLIRIWGIPAIALLWWRRDAADRKAIWIAGGWMMLGLLPYSFLTYQSYVPSRHTYLASVGLAVLVGTAANRLALEQRYRMLWSVALVTLACNAEIIWVKKMSQFRERAEPSELLTRAGVAAAGPVYVDCTPLGDKIATWVLQDAGAQPILRNRGPQGDPHCFSVEYTDRAGERIHLDREVATQKHGTFF